MKLIISVLITLIVIASVISPAQAVDLASGEQIFNVQCAGCHINGGNIVRRGKTLKQKALKKNGVDSMDAIALLVANGKNNMPAYKDKLSQQQIEDVATYVLEQAEKDWH